MGIASALHAEAVNKLGDKAIKEMEELKNHYPYSTHDDAINECIEIIKKYFTGWAE